MLISNLVQSQNDTIVLIFTLLPCMVMLGWGNEKERGENGEAYEWSNGRKQTTRRAFAEGTRGSGRFKKTVGQLRQR